MPRTQAILRRPRPPRAARAAAAALAAALALPAGAAPPSGPSAPPPDDCEALRAFLDDGPSGPEPRLALGRPERCAAFAKLPGPKSAKVLLRVGAVRSALGDLPGAERALKDADRLAPGGSDAPYRLARLLRDRPEEALRLAEDAARAAASPERRTAALRLAGEILLDLGDEAGARARLLRALEESGEDLETLLALARAERGRPEEAARLADLALRSAEAEPSWRRAAAYRLCAELWNELGEPGRAREVLGRVLEHDPDDLDALRALARLRRGAARSSPTPPAGAAPAGSSPEGGARRAPAREPDALESLRALSELRLAEGRRKEAVEAAERALAALEETPDWQKADAARAVARLWLRIGDARRARRALLHAAYLDPKSLRTTTLFRDVEAAAAPSEPLWIALGWTPADSLAELAEARAELGEPAFAESLFRRALDLDGEHAPSLTGLARLLDAAGRKEEARALRDRSDGGAPRPEPEPPGGPTACGVPGAGREKLPPIFFDRCVEAFPDDPAFRLDRGVARQLSGDSAAALADYREALRLKPDYPEARLSLASALAELGRPDEALAEAEAGVKLASEGEARAFLELRSFRDALLDKAPPRP